MSRISVTAEIEVSEVLRKIVEKEGIQQALALLGAVFKDLGRKDLDDSLVLMGYLSYKGREKEIANLLRAIAEINAKEEVEDPPVYFGLYNRYGYKIIDKHGDGTPVVQAGNNPYESTDVVKVADALPLDDIRLKCIDAGKNFADDNNGVWDGATYDEDGEEAYAFLEEVV